MGAYIVIIQKIVVAIGLIGVVGAVILLLADGQIEKVRGVFTKGTGRAISDNREKHKEKSKKNKSKVNIKHIQTDLLDFDEIKSFTTDDGSTIGLIVQNNGKRFVGILEVFGVNYNILSIEEREILEEAFTSMLNGLDYPIQIFIQSRKLDLESYLKKYDSRLDEIKEVINKTQHKLEFLKESNQTEEAAKMENKLQRLTNQFNYGVKIRNFIARISEPKNMLQRKYYIVISYEHDKSKFNEKLTFDEIAANAFYDISNKAKSLIAALERANLSGILLSPVEVAEVLYISYNKGDSEHYKLKNALKSRFSSYFVTGQPVELKALRRQKEELQKSLKEGA
ncbi:MAG: hypothetical protein H0Z24_03385 [Thermosipho sp. (in: Bacteria)]|nr:hypothetical protein [Thermosipho sp. (in: thermotogales)]